LALLHADVTFDGAQQRFLPVGIPAHIIHRGVNRQICFAADEDIAAYVNWLKEAARQYGVLIHASEISISTAGYSCNPNNKDQPSERSPRKTNSPQVISKKFPDRSITYKPGSLAWLIIDEQFRIDPGRDALHRGLSQADLP
jgi:REP element-mobilizing transposase RayT